MKTILQQLFSHQTLTADEAYQRMGGLAEKRYPEVQVAALLAVLAMRPVTVEEIAGFRRALIERANPIDLSDYAPIDIVGTGGDGKNTFNISTCSCFVVAGAGYRVAKHGNYGATSVSGASTVLERHGVAFSSSPDRLRRSIEQSGVAYLHAPLFHPALAAVGGVRRALQFKTVFNLLGPLVNPCRPACQLLGVANLSQMRLYARVFEHLGLDYAVVNSLDGYDEISLTSEFKVMTRNLEKIYRPAELGLDFAAPQDLFGGKSADEAAAIFDAVLTGTSTRAQRQCVKANSAMAICTLCPEKPMAEALAEAETSLASGRALECFKKFVEINQD